MKPVLAVAAVTAVFLGNAVRSSAQDVNGRIEVLNHWQGVFRGDDLREHEPDRPFIADEEQWRRVWNAWRPDDDVPEIDFERELVLVATVDGPNRLRGDAFLDESGDVELRLASTRIGGPGFGYLLLHVAREGIRSVSGQSIEPMEADDVPAEYINVEIKGRLRTGIFAIGGETTGILISASDLMFELDLGDDAELRQAAAGLNGETVIVTGRLEGRRGVEVRLRYIVIVDTLVPAAADETNDE